MGILLIPHNMYGHITQFNNKKKKILFKDFSPALFELVRIVEICLEAIAVVSRRVHGEVRWRVVYRYTLVRSSASM